MAGHLIGWGSYRDQWLSEGLAQYMALLYLKERIERGDELFLEAIQAHTDELTGSIRDSDIVARNSSGEPDVMISRLGGDER